MTLAQIAKAAGTSRAELRSFAGRGEAPDAARLHVNLRNFIRQAFTAGHDMEQIMAYVDRTEIMVTHALRMVCVDKYGAEYGQPLDGISRILRAA